MRIWNNGTPSDPERSVLNIAGATITDDVTKEATTITTNQSSSFDTAAAGALTIGGANATSVVLGKAGQAYSFNGVTAAAVPTPAGYSTMQTAGSTTNVFTNTATTGGVGSTQFTFGDVVAALKTLGLLKQ